jgi:hypothetical protein
MADAELQVFFDRRLWDYVDSDDPSEFDRASDMVCRKWEARKRSAGEDRGSRVAWLEGVSYRLLKAIIESDTDNVEQFEQRSSRYGRDRAGKGASTNLFQRGLMALFAHDPNAITPRDRERIGKRLWHAYRHFVPPEFLAGFLCQIRSAGLLKRAAANEIELGFEDWVAEKLFRARAAEPPVVDPEPLERRGTYPKQIQRLAKRRLDQNSDWD